MNLSRLNHLGEALRDATFAYQSRVALIEANRDRENERWTYRQIREEGDRLGGLLQHVGVQPDDMVAILMSNQGRWCVSGLGALWAGARLMPVDYKLTPKEQWALMAHGMPKVLITEFGIWQRLKESRPASLKGLTVLVTDTPKGTQLEDALPWDADKGRVQLEERTRDDIAAVVYSSGTGGTPKGCMLTHQNYLAQAEVLATLFPMVEGDRYFSILPTNHAIDFMCGFIIPLLSGATVVHQRTLRPQYLASTMKRYRSTHMALVPMILKALEGRVREKMDALPPLARQAVDGLLQAHHKVTREKPRYGLSRRLLKPFHDAFGGHLRLLFCGGAFVEQKSADFFYQLGIPVVIGYGLTEAGTVVTVNDLKPYRGDTVGKTVPGTRVEIRNADATGVGEVWVSGPTVMKGYLHEPEKTAEVLEGDWLATGDLGKLDPTGHLQLTGRLRNMIVTEGGKNIYPEDVESAFSDLDASEESCVFATNYIWPKEALTGETLTLVVRPGEGEEEDELLEAVDSRNKKLAEHKRIRTVLMWNEAFPRTASMKVKRLDLASQLQETDRDTLTLRSLP